jgi:hypothetical protein
LAGEGFAFIIASMSASICFMSSWSGMVVSVRNIWDCHLQYRSGLKNRACLMQRHAVPGG